jgi:hypothetical protein
VMDLKEETDNVFPPLWGYATTNLKNKPWRLHRSSQWVLTNSMIH